MWRDLLTTWRAARVCTLWLAVAACGGSPATHPTDAGGEIVGGKADTGGAWPDGDAAEVADAGAIDGEVAAADAGTGPGDATPTDATAGDAGAITPTADASGADDGAAAGPDATDAGSPSDGVCFWGAPPAAGVWVAPLPKPAPCGEVATPAWFDGIPAPAPSLNLKVGWRDASGGWHPYQDGDWVPLEIGLQGYFHVDLAPLVELPGKSAPTEKVEVQTFGLFGCNEVATGTVPKINLIEAPNPGPWYTIQPSQKVVTMFGVSASKVAAYCGKWLEVYWRVRLPGSPAWGEVKLMLRTYVSTAPPTSPGGP